VAPAFTKRGIQGSKAVVVKLKCQASWFTDDALRVVVIAAFQVGTGVYLDAVAAGWA